MKPCPTCGSTTYDDHGLPDCEPTAPEQGWDHINERPTMVVTYRLFEDDHGLRCPRCQRTVLPGQPYESILTGVNDDGSPVSELVCVYCAGTQPNGSNEAGEPRD